MKTIEPRFTPSGPDDFPFSRPLHTCPPSHYENQHSTQQLPASSATPLHTYNRNHYQPYYHYHQMHNNNSDSDTENTHSPSPVSPQSSTSSNNEDSPPPYSPYSPTTKRRKYPHLEIRNKYKFHMVNEKKSNHKHKRGTWTAEEHEGFLRGYELYGNDWKRISQELVPTRSKAQLASHAQKYFQRAAHLKQLDTREREEVINKSRSLFFLESHLE
jgi:SHAQKYF class myb-like DNA-binding protein